MTTPAGTFTNEWVEGLAKACTDMKFGTKQREDHPEIAAINDSFFELAISNYIAAHAPKQKWEAKEKALRVFILHNADHGVDDTGEYCRAGEFTRTVFEDGAAEVYSCTCGLDELRTILNREQEKQP